ncbi:MAG: RdgB/HAM1 family non-canonical purine NTP pyrophosphatase [Ignavibacteria bacterium]|nr:RdgB/HAM1 family non-canonical purine NTP pyrophosphatase [Ignavibacteria bacterium]
MKILVASQNEHKIDELRAMFKVSLPHIELESASSYIGETHIEETGKTFEENAFIKAHFVHLATGFPVLADDSGLEVHALYGAPGVYSARWAGENATDEMNRKKVINELLSEGHSESMAQFRCVLCYADSLRTVFAEGTCIGTVSTTESGTSGFGYDPIFRAEGNDRSFAELQPAEKNALSHRGRAVANLVVTLSELLANDEPSTMQAVVEPIASHTDDFEHLVRAAIATATNNIKLLQDIIAVHVHDVPSATRMYEVLLQSYLFGGFPAALDSLTVLHRHCSQHLPAFTLPAWNEQPLAAYKHQGMALAGQVYGSVLDPMLERLTDVSPELSAWMILEGYGKTLSRAGLDIQTRELCIIAMLAVQQRHTQLFSHIRGALLVGVPRAQVKAVADLICELCGAEYVEEFESILKKLSD